MIMAFSDAELTVLADLEERCTAFILQSAWSGRLLDDVQKLLIGMAVSWTYGQIKENLAIATVALTDPNVVHLNMLRGGIAKPSWDQIKHIYPEQFNGDRQEGDFDQAGGVVEAP
jgi:23S rRNA C2498 (ribose-2'-O)-methylase RlmM